MVYKKKQLLLAFVLAVLAGAGLHFVYGPCPQGVTALFSPVNESIWEHVKILFWPYLAAAVWLTWGRPTALRPWLLTGVGTVWPCWGWDTSSIWCWAGTAWRRTWCCTGC